MMSPVSFYHCFVVSLILSFYSVFGSEPIVTSFTSDITHSRDSSSVFMTCKVDNLPTSAAIQFSKITPSGPVLIESKYGKYAVMDGMLFMMIFSKEDAGEYRCSVTGYDTYKDLTLNYEAPPSMIPFTQWEYNFDKGDEFKLYCNVTGAPQPKVWWEKRDDNKFKSEGPLLHIPSITANDIGTYYCKADNNLGTAAQGDIRIKHVNYAPEMTCVNTTFVSKQGWNVYVTMKCEVRAYPVEKVEWFKKTETGRNQVIEDDPKFVIFHASRYDDSPQGWYHVAGLHIMVTEPGDAGTYIGVATNKMGTQEQEFTLTVV